MVIIIIIITHIKNEKAKQNNLQEKTKKKTKESNLDYTMQIDWVYQVTDCYNSSHDMGLYVVVKAGKKFWTLQPIETKALEEAKVVSDAAYWGHSGKRIAKKPIKLRDDSKHLLVSFDNYEPKDDSAVTSGRGAGCYKSFHRVLPDKNGDFIYLSSSEHYG